MFSLLYCMHASSRCILVKHRTILISATFRDAALIRGEALIRGRYLFQCEYPKVRRFLEGGAY